MLSGQPKQICRSKYSVLTKAKFLLVTLTCYRHLLTEYLQMAREDIGTVMEYGKRWEQRGIQLETKRKG